MKDSPDLVSYMLALRTELHMRIVMPAVVPHSGECPFLAMSRFETGVNGNPHQHGFSVGIPAPRFGRVLADVDGNGDVQGNSAKDSEEGYQKLVLEFLSEPGARDGLEKSVVMGNLQDAMRLNQCGADDGSSGEENGGSDNPGDDAAVVAQAEAVLNNMLEGDMLVEAVVGARHMYRRSEGVRQAEDAENLVVGREGQQGRQDDVRVERLVGQQVELQLLTDRNVEVSKQSDLEKRFAEFFGRLVSEWNPCYSETGQCRYRWDEEIGAHDVEWEEEAGEEKEKTAGLKDGSEGGAVAEKVQKGRAEHSEQEQEGETAEQKACRAVESRWPERLRLSSLLDKVFGAASDEDAAVDVQRVRRLVAALGNGWSGTRSTVSLSRSLACMRVRVGRNSVQFAGTASPMSLWRGVVHVACGWRRGSGKGSGTRGSLAMTSCVAATRSMCCLPTWAMWIGVRV